MKTELNKLVNNEYLNSSQLYKLEKLGLILKITYTQYVLTERGLFEMTN